MPVECITSTASRVVVAVGDTVVADTTGARILFETNLPPRYYIPFADIRSELLTPTDTSTHCPYKGDARYWTVTVEGTEHPDIVWGTTSRFPSRPRLPGSCRSIRQG